MYSKKELDALRGKFKVSSKKCVYTAIFGNYDKLNIPIIIDDKIDYICFTDKQISSSPVWQVVVVEPKNCHPQLQAKFFKVNPHLILSQYDISAWIDGNRQINSSLNTLLNSNHVFSLYLHQKRTRVIIEARECIRWKKDRKEIIENQYAHYSKEGFKDEHGLYCGTFLVRKHNIDIMVDMMTLWWREINKHSIRDQLSLPYVFWKLGFTPKIIPGDVTNSEYFSTVHHSKPSANDGSISGIVKSKLGFIWMEVNNFYKKIRK